MARHAWIGGLIAAALVSPLHTAWAASTQINAAVADAARPDSDKERDAARKPAETLEFSDVKPGEQIVELLPGGGYFTRLFSKAVGPKGHVYAWVPPRPANAPADMPDMAAKVNEIAADPGYKNVTVVQGPLSTLHPETPVNMVFTAQNYHDLHNIPGMDVAGFNKAVFNVLKPGGEYIVLDHAAAPGSGTQDTSTLHRIDPQAVKSEVQAAGFEFVSQSNAVANSADPHTAKVFDPTIRGKTDRFILKFRKPAH